MKKMPEISAKMAKFGKSESENGFDFVTMSE